MSEKLWYYEMGTKVEVAFENQNSISMPEVEDDTYASIDGWYCAAQAQIFKKFIDTADNNASIVEIGAWKGKSCRHIAQMIKESGKKINYYIVDTFKGSQNEPNNHLREVARCGGSIRNIFDSNMKGMEKYFTVLEGLSSEVVTHFKNNSLDMVWIDGDHSYEGVLKDIVNYHPKLKKNGLLGGDDYHPSWGVPRAVNASLGCLNVIIYGQCWRTIKK